MTVVITRVMFTQQMNEAFEQLEDGNTEVLKEEFDRQVSQISDIVELRSLGSSQRTTGRSSSRSVLLMCMPEMWFFVSLMRKLKLEHASSAVPVEYFQHEETKEVKVDICDATIKYGYSTLATVDACVLRH